MFFQKIKTKYWLMFLFFLNLFLSVYLYRIINFPTFSLVSCQGDICPYVKALIKQLNNTISNKNQHYQIYTANFEENDSVLIPKNLETSRILWLGSRTNLTIRNLEYYDYILASSTQLQDFLKQQGITSYYFPIFSYNQLHKNLEKKFIAIIGNPPFIKDILQKNDILFRHYQLKDINKIKDDMSLFKAAFVENTALTADSIDLHPIFLDIAEAGIPISTYWGWPTIQEPVNLFNDNINFYMFEADAAVLINEILTSGYQNEISQQSLLAKRFVLKNFSLNAATKKLISILINKKFEETDTSSLNIDIQAAVGHIGGGDYWLAKDLNKAFNNIGWNTSICFINSPVCFPTAINIILRGEIPVSNKKISGKYNILYLAFATEKVFDFDNYVTIIENMFNQKEIQAFAIASNKIAAKLKDLHLPVYYVPQFTNTAKFYPDFDENLQSNVLFIGNYFPYRVAAPTIYKAGFDISIYGDYWPAQWAKKRYIDNRFLRKYYSSAKIVLNDARDGMRKAGFISNRVFDVTASGGFLISDYMPEIEEIYGDCIPMWKKEEELISLVDYYLAPEHENERLEKAKCAREITLKNFTSDIIAQKFMHIISEIKKEKSI